MSKSLIILLVLFVQHNSAAKVTNFAITLKFDYDCGRNSTDGYCYSHYNITSPIQIIIDGITNPIYVPCTQIVGLGFAKGYKLASFIYDSISRVSAGPVMRRRRHDKNITISDTGESSTHLQHIQTHMDSVSPDQISFSQNSSAVNVSSQLGIVYPDMERYYQNDRQFLDSDSPDRYGSVHYEMAPNNCAQSGKYCPKHCHTCFVDSVHEYEHYKWKLSDGSTCFKPRFMHTYGFKCDFQSDIPCPWFIWQYKYMYLSNAEHEGNPCKFRGPSPSLSPDLLQCQHHNSPFRPNPLFPGIKPQGFGHSDYD